MARKNQKKKDNHEKIKNKEKGIKRKNINFFSGNENNLQNYNLPVNYSTYQILFNPFSSNNFSYQSFGPTIFTPFQNYKNNSYINYSNYSINNNSIENTQESGSTSYISTSEDKNYCHYYDNFGDNYYDSLQKGIKEISQIYNNNKRNRPKVSLLCNYYCNLDRTPEEEIYMNNEIERLGYNLKKILMKNKNENKDNTKDENNDFN